MKTPLLASTVVSTTLTSVVYDVTTQSLWLEFRNGAVYCYFPVPQPLYQALLEAPSKGAYFNRNIRGRFQYRKELDNLRP
jgi:hypothetical protein